MEFITNMFKTKSSCESYLNIKTEIEKTVKIKDDCLKEFKQFAIDDNSDLKKIKFDCFINSRNKIDNLNNQLQPLEKYSHNFTESFVGKHELYNGGDNRKRWAREDSIFNSCTKCNYEEFSFRV